MTTTRKFKVGAKTVVIQNVPEYVTDEQLVKFTLQKMIEAAINNIGVAS